MSEPIIFQPKVTQAGEAAAFNAQSDGLELTLTHVSFGSGLYTPTGEETALQNEIKRVTISGGSRVNPTQIRMLSIWPDDSDNPLTNSGAIGEVGFWAGDTLFSVWSREGEPMGYKTPGVDFVLFNDLVFKQLGPDSVTVQVDPSGSAALAALSAHEGAFNAHPQYLLRRDVAKDSGSLAWLGLAAGTANALQLSLADDEALLTAYGAGQRFQFMAAATNTGPVTANIEGLGAIAIKKAGDTGLVDVDAGDIKAGAIFDLNFDGTYFQLGGGVGGGKAFERFSFTASVAQATFTAKHTPGSIIVLRNGREVTDYVSAADGSSITLTTPANLDDSIEILAFKSFKVADSYTKAEIDALWQTASALPVGAMLPFVQAMVPPGFVEVAGQVLSKATYPDLYAHIGDTFAKGDEPAGFFRMPESRAEFFRGWDHGRGVDAGRALGSAQQASYLYDAMGQLGSPHRIATELQNDDVADRVTRNITLYEAADTRTAASYADTGRSVRPRNLAVMWCMKAWNAPINQGQIDIAALAYLAAQASETQQGTARVATDAQMLDSANDTVVVTPKKLRKGFAISLGISGYIVFPTWMGGLIIQWRGDATAGGSNTSQGVANAWPLAFPTALFVAVAVHEGAAGDTYLVYNDGLGALDKRTQINVRAPAYGENISARIIGIGR